MPRYHNPFNTQRSDKRAEGEEPEPPVSAGGGKGTVRGVPPSVKEAAERAGRDTAVAKQALSVVAKLNAQLRAHKLVAQSQLQHEELTSKRSAIDATEFHAIIPINDYPQKARWRVTNKETMVQVSVACSHGAVSRIRETDTRFLLSSSI